MVSETVEATESATAEVTGLFDQAFRVYGESLKVAMKAQEETVKFWGEAAGKVTPVPSGAVDWIPTAQKNADEYLRLLESSYRRNAELLKKIVNSQKSGNGAELEKSAHELWEAAMEVARDNIQEVANTNLRVAQAWTEVIKKGAAQKVPVGK